MGETIKGPESNDNDIEGKLLEAQLQEDELAAYRMEDRVERRSSRAAKRVVDGLERGRTVSKLKAGPLGVFTTTSHLHPTPSGLFDSRSEPKPTDELAILQSRTNAKLSKDGISMVIKDDGYEEFVPTVHVQQVGDTETASKLRKRD